MRNIFLVSETKMEADELLLDLEQSETNSSEMSQDVESEKLIRRLTLFFVPISFAIILVLGLIGNSLVIGVVSWQSLHLSWIEKFPLSLWNVERVWSVLGCKAFTETLKLSMSGWLTSLNKLLFARPDILEYLSIIFSGINLNILHKICKL